MSLTGGITSLQQVVKTCVQDLGILAGILLRSTLSVCALSFDRSGICAFKALQKIQSIDEIKSLVIIGSPIHFLRSQKP